MARFERRLACSTRPTCAGPFVRWDNERVAVVDAQGPGIRLRDAVAPLDSTVLRAVHTARDGEAVVTDVAILDRTDPHTVQEGTVVLAVGVQPDEGDAVALVDRAARAGAAAVVLRSHEELPERLVEIAAAGALSLLTVPREMAWGQLYSLLRTAMSAGLGREVDAQDVPVGDLFALADAVAAAVGAPVTIEDAKMRVLSYSNLDQPIDEARRQTILGRMPPVEWQRRLEEAGVMARLRSGDGVVRFEHPGIAPRLAAGIRAGSELLGAIWVAEVRQRPGPDAEAALLDAAEAAAVHLIAHRASEDMKRRARGAFVREVLQGRVPAGGSLRSAGPYTVLAFRLEAPDGGRWTGNPERVLSIVSLFAESMDRDAMCALVDDEIWALVRTPSRDARGRLLELAAQVSDRVERLLGARVLTGIGGSETKVADMPRSRRGAEQALAVLARGRLEQSAVHIDDVRFHAVLLELLDLAAAHPPLRENGAVLDLARHDREHGSSYTDTLRAYLDSHGDVAHAAARLDIHPNTLRYRLRRLAEVGRISLDDPDERLVAAVQLRLHELDPLDG
jgi:PucR C-terminal helix-turn-helix domain/GGDEF-like domain/Purine catabolism regulatory protein-like family